MSKRPNRYWWASFAVFGSGGVNGWSFSDTVSTKHPFVLVAEWGDTPTYGTPTLLSWREITAEEYAMHGEAEPPTKPRSRP